MSKIHKHCRLAQTLQFTRFLLVAASALLAMGCNTLSTVKKQMAKGGYALWYPAEEGVEPGQFWVIEGDRKEFKLERPAQIAAPTPKTITFQSLKKTVDASISLDGNFAESVVSELGNFSAGLKAGTVTKVDVSFGATTVKRIPTGNLEDTNFVAQLPQNYQNFLKRCKRDYGDVFLVSAVVESAGMRYEFTCTNKAQLEARIPDLQRAVKGEFNLSWINDTKAVWSTPSDKPLVIGVALIAGDMLKLTEAEQARIIGSALRDFRKTLPLKMLR